MALLKKLTIRNFKCFRDRVEIPLSQATYLVGPNNAGKTAILAAINCFFNTQSFGEDLINRSALTARQEGFNRSEIGLTFDLSGIPGKARKKRLAEEFGDDVSLTKMFTWREASGIVVVEWQIQGTSERVDDLPKDLYEVVKAVAPSYIHPQEGAELLQRAQEKFKERLFHNWGRHASVAEKVKNVQDEWTQLRSTANSYLSSALSTRLRQIWPGAELKIELPERIQDVVAVSDISFRSSPTLPQITITSHGTGAQSAILYQTHYVLDSDRSLHQGIYFPIWLLEEPESFLHADIALQLAQLLSSEEWLNSIQMFISTHSPLILAGSKQSGERGTWVVCEEHSIRWVKAVPDLLPADIDEISSLMGDVNFPVYFDSTGSGRRVFVEDSRGRTLEKFEDAGIDVTKSLSGVGNVKKYLDVFSTVASVLQGRAFFVVDNDLGTKQLDHFIKGKKPDAELHGWKRIPVAENCFLVLLPPGFAAEDLFDEWESVVDECVGDVYDASMKLKSSIPKDLTRLVAELRGKPNLDEEDEIRRLVARSQDAKDRFWSRCKDWCFSEIHEKAIRRLILDEGS